jgi:Trk-type K+ transport system membrane component
MALNLLLGFVVWFTSRRKRERELQLREGISSSRSCGSAARSSPACRCGSASALLHRCLLRIDVRAHRTGATLLSGLDFLPASLNVWRAELQWLGGMGVIVLVVAVLPMIGVGGRQISEGRDPGPDEGRAAHPRMTQTAKGLWMRLLRADAGCFVPTGSPACRGSTR